MSDASGMDETDSGVSQLISVLTPAIVVMIVGTLLFCYQRTRKPDIYSPRRKVDLLDKGQEPPAELPEGSFGWMGAVWRLPEQWIFENVGLDAVVFLRTFRIGWHMFGMCMIIGAFVLIPVNDSADNGLTGDLDKLTFGNIKAGSSLLWLYLFVIWAFSLIVMYLQRKNYLEVIELVQADKRRNLCDYHYSVLVTAVAPDSRNDESLAEYFKGLYPETYSGSAMAVDTKDIDKKMDELTKTVYALEHAQGALAEKQSQSSDDNKRPTHKVGGPCACCCGTEVDSIEHYTEEKDTKAGELDELRKGELRVVDSAFVSFKSVAAATAAAQVRHATDPLYWFVEPAPEPRDVYWPNLAVSKIAKVAKGRVAFAITFALIVFWTIPVAFVTSLGNLEALTEQLPFLEPILDLPTGVLGLIQGLLPTILLAVLMALLPIFLRIFAIMGGDDSESKIQRSVMSTYFTFQVVHTFLVVTLSGALFQQLQNIADNATDPNTYVDLFSEALPAASSFFVNYVALKAFGAWGLELLRIGPLIVSWIKLKYLAKTDRERAEAVRPGSIDYGVKLPASIVIMVITLAYAAIAPLILVMGFLYFFIGYFVWKHQMVYVYLPQYQSGGKLWPQIFKYINVGLVIFQFTMVGLLGTKEGAAQAPLAFPLPFLTIAFHLYYSGNYNVLFELTPLEAAAAMDRDAGGPTDRDDLIDAFVPPNIADSLEERFPNTFGDGAAKKMDNVADEDEAKEEEV